VAKITYKQNNMKKLTMATICCVACCWAILPAVGQSPMTRLTDTSGDASVSVADKPKDNTAVVKLHFANNSSVLMPNYRENAKATQIAEQSDTVAQIVTPDSQVVPETTQEISTVVLGAPNTVHTPISRTSVPLIALKTDLMLWCGVMPDFKMGTWTPNLSAEFYFARHWSAQAGFAYSNWNAISGSKELYAVSVGDLELRRWFGKPSRFSGFYVGVYGQFGQYDIQSAPTAQTGSFWTAGIGAGWMQTLSKHWAIEAEVRGGYRSAQNDHYDIVLDGAQKSHYYYNHPSTESKFTPSLRLSIVYRIGKPSKK
jgi:Protein of unknown function (DUF3575)